MATVLEKSEKHDANVQHIDEVSQDNIEAGSQDKELAGVNEDHVCLYTSTI